MKRFLMMVIVLCLCGMASGQQLLTSGSTDEYIYFVARDVTDLHTRVSDLVAAGFTVSYSIGGGASATMTTPTVTEVSKANQPGSYSLLIDETGMTTLTAGKDQANLILSISHASIDRTTLAVAVKRPKFTAGQTVTAANGSVNGNLARILDTALPAETSAGYVATGFAKMYNLAPGSQNLTQASVNQGADNNVILANTTYGLSALKTLIDTMDAIMDLLFDELVGGVRRPQ